MSRLRFAPLDMTLSEHSDRSPSHKQRAKPGMAAYSILPITLTEASAASGMERSLPFHLLPKEIANWMPIINEIPRLRPAAAGLRSE